MFITSRAIPTTLVLLTSAHLKALLYATPSSLLVPTANGFLHLNQLFITSNHPQPA